MNRLIVMTMTALIMMGAVACANEIKETNNELMGTKCYLGDHAMKSNQTGAEVVSVKPLPCFEDWLIIRKGINGYVLEVNHVPKLVAKDKAELLAILEAVICEPKR